MALLNYTTQIDPDKTAMEITKILTSHGAKSVLTEYDESGNYVSSLSFQINLKGRDIAFRLPTKWEPVLEILKNEPRVPRSKCTQGQSVRVAWRIVKDWVEAQMALVETQMVTTEQVFLPYAIMLDGQTVSEKMLSGEKPLLLN